MMHISTNFIRETFLKKALRWHFIVEISFDIDCPVMIVEITLEGMSTKKKISCVLDTGATMTLIPWEIAYALGYDPHLSKEKIGVITASGTEYAPLIPLQSLSCLGMKKCYIPAIVHNLPSRSYVDGLLGLN